MELKGDACSLIDRGNEPGYRGRHVNITCDSREDLIMKKLLFICACFISALFFINFGVEAKMMPKGSIWEIDVLCDGGNQKIVHAQVRAVTQPEAEQMAKHQAYLGRYFGTDCKKPKILKLKKH